MESGVLSVASDKTLGIDLGTTNSSVSVYSNGQMVVIPVQGKTSMPSVVRFADRKKDNVQVGQTAKKYVLIKPKEVFSSIKSLMRNDDWKDDPAIRNKFTIEGELLSPTDIASKILTELKYQAQQWEHCDGNYEKVVICVPANSTTIYKQNVKDAAVAAGFGITNKTTGELLKDKNGEVQGISILEEPTAASLAYGVKLGFFNPNTSKEQNILVYDLGGGTFDVTILHIVSNEGNPTFTPVSTKGVAKLGGDDFDWALAGIIAKEIQDETGIDILNDPTQLANKSIVKDKAESAKIDFAGGLSSVDLNFTLEINGKDKSFTMMLDREAFVKSIKPLIDKSISCVKDAIQSANMTMDDISRIILVGGSTKGPWIREAIKKELGRDPYTADNVDTIVSQGASYYGILDVDKADSDGDVVGGVLSHYYGIELDDGTFSPMFEKGAKLDETGHLSHTATYYNSNDSGRVTVAGWATQEKLNIETDKNGTMRTDVMVSSKNEDNDPIFEWLGEYEVQIPRKPKGQVAIELTLTIDKENCIHAKAVVDGKPTEADWKH